MLSILERVRRSMFRLARRPKPRRVRRSAPPTLEILEDRLNLDAMLFTPLVAGTATAPAAWNVAGNWTDLNPLGAPHVPNASDDVSIPGTAGFVSLNSGEFAEINSIVTAAGTTLKIPVGNGSYPTVLQIDSNPPPNPPPGALTSPVPGSNFFGGSVIDAGLIDANTTDPFSGTNIIFADGSTIGPGDLNGNLQVGPASSMTFLGGGSGDTFASGATIGQGAGNIIIAGAVAIMGDLIDNTATLDIVPGGVLGGPGTLDDWSNVNWTGGIISLSGGITVYTSFTASGPNPLTLFSTLTNEESTDLGGTGGIGLGTSGLIDNVAGTLTLSQTVTGMFPLGVTNSALGILDIPATLAAPVGMSVPFTNDGNLNVGAGSELDVAYPTNPNTGAPSIDLDGTLGLDGNLYLYSTATSSTGFTLTNHPGSFVVGDPRTGETATLLVPSDVSNIIQGNLEIANGSLLTGGGTVYNSGRLQLDVGSSTVGLGAYVQSNSGTLAIVVSPMGMYTPLTVTGSAQLSGTLVLPGYVPVVGSSFTVVTAGSLSGHFDSIPDGMEETDTDTSATVTQVDPPAGD